MTFFEPEFIVLETKIKESLVLMKNLAEKKYITIDYELPSDLLVYADQNMLGGIVRNLVSNAIKFTPNSGNIKITAKPVSNKWVEITVKDNGIGMNKNLLDNLFRLDVKNKSQGD